MRKIVTTATVLTLLLACKSQLTGNEGNLTFSYVADDDLLDFNKPLAVGAMLDLTVTEAGTGDNVTLTSATSDDTGVLDIVDYGGTSLTIGGVAEGNVLLSVGATIPDSTEVTDSINLNVRVPEVHLLSHTCEWAGDGGSYLAGQQIYVPFEFEAANGQSIIGYGYYPVTSSDPTLMSLDTTWQGSQYMRLDTTAPGEVTLTSDIDGSELPITLVEEADLDGVSEPAAWVLEDIDVGDTNWFYVLPEAAGEVVCQAEVEIEVESLTPETCTVASGDNNWATGPEKYEYGWFTVTGEAEGTCTWSVTYPGGADGVGVSAEFSYPIEP